METLKKPGRFSGKALCVGLLLSVTVVWGYGIVVTDDALTGGLGVFSMLAGRFILAGAVLFAVRFCLRGTKVYKKFTKKELSAGVLTGTMNFFGFFFQAAGLLYTNTAKSGMLTGAYVIVVPVVYCILRRKFRFKPVFDAAVFLMGMCILFDVRGAGGNFNRGDVLTLVGALFFAAQIILVDRFACGVNIFNFNVIQMSVMGGLGLLGAVVFELPLRFEAVNGSACLFALLYLGILSSAYSYPVQTFAQSRLSPSLAAILLSLEALTGALFSLAVGNVSGSASLLIGCAVMAAASVSAAVSKTSEK